MAAKRGITTARATGRVTLFESVGFWHCGLELFEPLQLGPEVDEEAAAELDDDPEPDESGLEPDWRFNKELSPAIGLSTRFSNETGLGR